MIKDYIKQVNSIKAVQFTGDNYGEIIDFINPNGVYSINNRVFTVYAPTGRAFDIQVRDFIVKNGSNVIIFSEEEFNKTYSEVSK